MICPLQPRITNSTKTVSDYEFKAVNGCLEDCAWYDEKNKCCVIQTLAKNLSNIKVSVAR